MKDITLRYLFQFLSIYLSAQQTSDQRNKISKNEQISGTYVRDVEKYLQGKKVHDSNHYSLGLFTVLNKLHNELNISILCHLCADQCSFDLLMKDVIVSGNKHSNSGLPGMKFLEHLVWAILFIVSRSICHSDIPGVIVAKEMRFDKIIISVVTAMRYILLTKKVIVLLQL